MPRIVLITGGMSGIGLATAEAFQKVGDAVFIVDRQETPAGQAVVRASGGKYFSADVRDFAAAETIVTQIVSEKGRLDVLVNNAGISRDHLVWKMSETDWDDVLAVNLKGAFNFLHAAAPIFWKQQSGKVVSVSSINALRGKMGLANYSASKAGLIALTRTVARELGSANVNVNAVAPGMIETPLTNDLPDEVLAKSWEEAALGRLGKPQEIADVILFLCSEQARHITGQVIVVDGGQTA
jgi:3-oxoacyl-[acyl-carrier protein] reductase